MLMRNNFVLITENVSLAACISSAFADKDVYFPVFDPPRTKRPDADNEVIKLVNAIARLKPLLIVYGDQEETISAEIAKFVNVEFMHISSSDDLSQFEGLKIKTLPDPNNAAKLLHQTCYSSSEKKTAVIVENAKAISSIIAANYAVAHDSDFFVISVEDDYKRAILDKLNTISNTPHREIRNIEINDLANTISSKIPKYINWNKYEKILFITEGVPYSIAMPDMSVIHANSLNLGHFFAHNIYESLWSKNEKEGVVGLFFRNTDLSTANEEKWFADSLFKAKGFNKTIKNTHTALSELEIEILPYDVLYVATHGAQVTGKRNTYSFTAKDKAEHTVVLNESSGVGGKVFFIESVDEIKKGEPDWTIALGKIWAEIAEQLSQPNNLQPIEGEEVQLPMRQLVLGRNSETGLNSPINFDRLAYQQRPLIIVNACGSWSDISSRFMYAGAAAYIGTLWPITGSEAENFAEPFLENLFDKDLCDAFLIARETLDDKLKLNYTFSGSFESKFDPGADYGTNALTAVRKRLKSNIAKSRITLEERKGTLNKMQIDWHERDIWFFEKELEDLKTAVDSLKDKRGEK